MGNVKVADTYFSFVKRSLPFANGSDRLQKGQLCRRFLTNRTLALRSLVTNASFNQWVRILLMPKIDRAHENYLTPKIWETHLREIFYGTLIFEQSSIISIGHYSGGHTSSCPPTWRPKLLFACILLDRYLRSDVLKTLLNHLFNNFLGNSLFQKSHFGHVTSYELIHFNKMVRVWKTKSLLFCF